MTISIFKAKQTYCLLTVVVLTFLALTNSCTNPDNSKEEIAKLKAEYDSAKAAYLEADEYGMHQYVMAFLKKGPNRSIDSAESMELQKKHLQNIGRMADDGDLVLAGPFLDTGELRGIYIFDVKTVEEARELTRTDPAIKAGSLIMELKPWYGSAALMELNELHKKITKAQF